MDRQKAFDDFYAVAEALVADGVTRPELIGIWGASNGGLLTAVALTQRPELFGIWTREWDDLVAFQIVPVVSSGEAADALASGG